MLCGGLVLWWYETRERSITLTTAPTDRQVVELLWGEVRSQAPAGIPLMPKAAKIDGDHPHHYAVGYTARDRNAFQGRHEQDLLVIFDECVGIDAQFWHGAEGMTTGPGNRWLALCNPTDVTSEAYSADESGDWHVISVSVLDHPNVAAELAGQEVPYPSAVRVEWIDRHVRRWCTPVATPTEIDIEWPPASGRWHRPGPLFEAGALGRWPSQAINSVWGDVLLALAFREGKEPLPEPKTEPCEIGVDVARYGDDMTVYHVHRGPVSLHHESHNGWGTDQTAGRAKQLADQWGRHCGLDGKRLVVNIDDDGVGGGVVDQAGGYTFRGCSAARKALVEKDYPNRRSEMWFTVAEMAKEGRVDLSRLPADVRRDIKRQLRAPRWKLDSQGRRVVEPKDDTKARLGRSPDDADAVNLSYNGKGVGRPFAGASAGERPAVAGYQPR